MGNKIIADIYDRSYITDIHSSCVHYNVIHKQYVFLVVIFDVVFLCSDKVFQTHFIGHRQIFPNFETGFFLYHIHFKRQRKKQKGQ
jgi:hypothetical protein